MAIKKVFQPLMSLLAANMGATVETIYAQAEALVSAKVGGGGGKATNFHRADDGTVIAVFDYAFKVWVDPRLVEFGPKAGTPTGLNTMCKAGVSAWTKLQADFKKGKDAVVAELLAGKISSDEAQEQIAALEEARNATPALPADIQGFETLEDCLNNSEVNGLAI